MLKHITPAWNAPHTVHALTTLKSSLPMPETKEALAANVPNPLAWLTQTHSNSCVIVESMSYSRQADAAINFNAKAACCVVTADCVPIILTDTAATFVAAIHAGWRGIANGVIEQTLSKLESKNIIAWLGPCICSDCYVVAPEFQKNFDTEFDSCFSPQSTFDLKKACNRILRKQNIMQIYETAFCTSCDNDLFFSARKEGISCGRIVTCIWKED